MDLHGLTRNSLQTFFVTYINQVFMLKYIEMLIVGYSGNIVRIVLLIFHFANMTILIWTFSHDEPTFLNLV